jgi:hypothetical protein
MKKTLIVVVTAVIVIVTSVAIMTRSTRLAKASDQFQEGNGLSVDNKTRAFQIITAARDGSTIRLSFRNDYSKPINAFTLAGSPNSGVQVDLADSDHEIAPGAVYDFRVAAVSMEPSGSLTKPLKLTVLNVVFEDGTGDGDYQATMDIKNRRLGEKVALTRIIPLIEQASNVPDSDTPAAMKELKRRVSALCETLAQEESGEARGGVLRAQRSVMEEIEQAERKQKETGNIILRDELSRIKEHFQRKSARLKD